MRKKGKWTGWSSIANWYYTYARIRTDSTDYPLDHIPPVFGRTSLEYQAKKLRMEASVVYNGWKRLRDYNTTAGSEDNLEAATEFGSPAWYTLNVRGSYAFNAHLGLQLALENMLDMNYRTFGSGVSAPGRNFMVGCGRRFKEERAARKPPFCPSGLPVWYEVLYSQPVCEGYFVSQV